MQSARRRILHNNSFLEPRQLDVQSRVGFDTLPDQLVNRERSRGFAFNILCIGETGVGKSTLIETLFNKKFEDGKYQHLNQNITLHTQTHDLEDGGVRLKLSITETRGFGDQINREACTDVIIKYIDEQFENYLQEELKISRDLIHYHDTRIHACLYFLPPTGHSLKSLDLVVLKKLQQKVNVIPIIAKADTITKSELQRFKETLRSEFEANGLELYEPEEDADGIQIMQYYPFAVVASNDMIVDGQEKIRVRQYPWGIVEIENEEHSDFVKLRETLLKTHMERIRQSTHYVRYEMYRKNRLQEMGYSDTANVANKSTGLREAFEEKKRQLMTELSKKEDEMRQLFVAKVKQKEIELKAAEQELSSKNEKLDQIHKSEKQKYEAELLAIEQELQDVHTAKKEAEDPKGKKKDKKEKKDKH